VPLIDYTKGIHINVRICKSSDMHLSNIFSFYGAGYMKTNENFSDLRKYVTNVTAYSRSIDMLDTNVNF